MFLYVCHNMKYILAILIALLGALLIKMIFEAPKEIQQPFVVYFKEIQ